MIKRIELIIQSQNLTPSQFADRIGIQRSGLSHILSGRNNPSLDFVQKVLSAFPDLNPSWFLQGRGRMYVNLSDLEQGLLSSSFTPVASGNPSEKTETPQPAPHPRPEEFQTDSPRFGLEDSLERSPSQDKQDKGMETEPDRSPASSVQTDWRPQDMQVWMEEAGNPRIRRILLFYEDGTFEEYRRRQPAADRR